MDLSITSLYKNIVGYLAKLSKKKKIFLVVLLVSVLAGSVILTSVLENAGYTVLYRGLSPAEGSQIVSLLDSMGTTYKLEDDGTILVQKSSVALLKMQLAAEGYPKSTLGYDLFTNQTNLMTTDYEKRQYLVFQLQDRLQESLKTLEGVKSAIVTLNVPDDSSFVLKTDKPLATASVVLELYSYTSLSEKQIKGIEALVARSVPGLTVENVTIVDSTGEVLNGAEAEKEDNSDEALAQMKTISQINDYYKEKVTNFLVPVFGEEGVSVAVSVQVDFQKKNSEQTIYTPVVGDSGILSKEEFDRESINGGTVPGMVAGTASNTGVATYANPTASPGTGDDQSASESGSNEYLVNKLIQGIEDKGGKITDMTVAVVINSSYLADDVVQRYKEMVAYGVGIPVEKVVVTHAEFTPKPQTPAVAAQQAMNMDNLIFTIAGAFVLLIALIVFFALRKSGKKNRGQQPQMQQQAQPQQQPQPQQHQKHLRGKRRHGQQAAQPEHMEQQSQPGQPGQSAQAKPLTQLGKDMSREAQNAQIPGEIVLTETREQGIKRLVKEFATANPEIVAQLLRTWMKEDETK